MSGRSDERPTGRSREPAAQRTGSGPVGGTVERTAIGTAGVAGVGTVKWTAIGTAGEPLVVEAQMTTHQVAHEAEQSMLRDIDAILARIESGLASERAAMDALLKRVTRTAA
jgi:hypothetical protein